MKITIDLNYLELVGRGWYNQPIAQQRNLSRWDINEIEELCLQDIPRIGHKAHEGICRDGVEDWFGKHCGDFQIIEDFYAMIHDFHFEWEQEESECKYNKAMYGEDD